MSDHELVIRGERFACSDAGFSAWVLMRLAKAQTSGDETIAMAGMYDSIIAVVRPEEHERFGTFMQAQGIQFPELNEALGTLIAGYAARPTERPSESPAGPQLTGPSSRVVSLSKPAGQQPLSSTAGTQAAS